MNAENLFVQSEQQLRKTQREIVTETLHEVLPKILRSTKTKKYLTTKDLKEDYNIGYELQKYYRDEGLLGFSQEGRKIWYRTSEIEKFILDRRVEAKK